MLKWIYQRLQKRHLIYFNFEMFRSTWLYSLVTFPHKADLARLVVCRSRPNLSTSLANSFSSTQAISQNSNAEKILNDAIFFSSRSSLFGSTVFLTSVYFYLNVLLYESHNYLQFESDHSSYAFCCFKSILCFFGTSLKYF